MTDLLNLLMMFYKTLEKLRKVMKICAAAMIAMIVCGVSLAHANYAQVLDRKVTVNITNVSLEQALYKLQEISGVKIYFSLETLETSGEGLVSVHVSNETLGNILNDLLRPRDIRYRVDEERDSIIILRKVAQQSYIEPISKAASASLSTVTIHDERITVTGTVTDATTQQPLAGVSILVKGTTQGTTSDSEGRYSLNAEGSDVLMFSFIGFAGQEVAVGFRTKVDVELQPDVQSLKVVEINAGYYNVTEREKTGSISKVSADVIEKQPVTNPLAVIQGRVPGVYVQQTSGTPGADFKIQIRGRNSLRTDGNEPLFIVDGIPFSMEKTFSPNTSSGPAFGTLPSEGMSRISPLTSLNTGDIESIEILKDADATAIYGSRGANGVVLITTKKGKPGKTKFDLNVYTGMGNVRRIDFLNTRQYLDVRRQAFANDGVIPSADPNDDGSLEKGNRLYAPDLMVWDTTRYTDWQKVFLESAQTMSVQASLSGGSNLTQFLFSMGCKSENSVFPGNLGYRKESFHLSVNHHSLDNRFSINASVLGTKDNSNQPVLSLIKSRLLPPNAPKLYASDGKLNWENSTWQNPLADLEMKYSNDVVNLIGNTVIRYEIVNGLHVKSSVGINYIHSDERNKRPSTYYDPAAGYTSDISDVFAAFGTNQSWSVEPQAVLDRNILKGRINVILGATFQEQQLQRSADYYRGFPNDALMDNLAAARTRMSMEYVESLYRYSAVFGRLNYNWDGKYVINLTARRDGSSRFGPRKQFANFGAVGLAWIFSNENFVKDNIEFISFGKLRASYGATGNDQIGDYQYLDTYAPGSTGGNQYQGIAILSSTKLFNPNYAWEVNRKFEAALELGFVEDRITTSVSYFRNFSSNQLVEYSLPQTTGFTGILANLPATVQNTGVEIELSTINVKRKFTWTTSANLTVPRNKLVSFPNLQSSSYANRYALGKPLSVSRVYQATGVDPQSGLWTFKDMNGDDSITIPEDLTYVFVGQDFFGGIGNGVSYKGFSIDVLFQLVKQTGKSPAMASGMPGHMRNVPLFLLSIPIWNGVGDDAEIQRLHTDVNRDAARAFSNYRFSDEAVVDASFVRLKNLAISYRLPAKLTKGVQCRIYFQGQNLWVLTDYPGDDPENLSFDALPPLKMYTGGIHLIL